MATPLRLPSVQTIIKKIPISDEPLPVIDYAQKEPPASAAVGVHPVEIGIELSVEDTESPPARQIGERLPQTLEEAYENLDLIKAQRTGSRNRTYNANQLRQIAKNLDLPSTGNKDVLANRIRDKVMEFYRAK